MIRLVACHMLTRVLLPLRGVVIGSPGFPYCLHLPQTAITHPVAACDECLVMSSRGDLTRSGVPESIQYVHRSREAEHTAACPGYPATSSTNDSRSVPVRSMESRRVAVCTCLQGAPAFLHATQARPLVPGLGDQPPLGHAYRDPELHLRSDLNCLPWTLRRR